MQTDTPEYRQHDSGLYVPEAIARRRQVWTRTEWKLYERALSLFAVQGLAVKMQCNEPRCDDRAIVKLLDGDNPVLRCGCSDRVFTNAF